MTDDQVLREGAAEWALRLAAGLVERGEVIAWAARVILASKTPPDWIVEVSLGSGLSDGRLVDLLCPIQSRPVEGKALTRFCRCLWEAWAGSKLSGPAIGWSLYQLLQLGFLPERLTRKVCHIEDGYDLEADGIVPAGDAEQELSDLLRQEMSCT